MKKIKKKKPATSGLPAFVIGWTHGDSPPPGYLAAWFDQRYGGPLHVRFLSKDGHHVFEASHTSWSAHINIAPWADQVAQWEGRLHWDHSHLGCIFTPTNPPSDRQEVVRHVARIAKGLTLLTDGTAYDVATGSYVNPSDWQDRDLEIFRVTEHVQVEEREDVSQGRVWFHTRGLSKFGLEEVEMFQPIGVPSRETHKILEHVTHHLIDSGTNPKVGACLEVDEEGRMGEIVRHRTDPIFGVPVAFRELRLL